MGGNFRLQNGLNLLCRVWPSGQRPKDPCLCVSLTLCMIFKICSQFSEMAILEKIVKNPFLKKCQLLFSVFQCGALSCSHAHNKLVENLVNVNSLENMRFYVFRLQN